MGQKVNPNGFRVGVIRDWNTRWYASKKEFSDFLIEDKKIREHLKKAHYAAGVSKIDIERAAGKVTVSIHTARPGVLIGKGGVGVDAIKADVTALIGKPVNVNIMEVKNPDANAQLVAESIAAQLEKRISFRRAMKQSMGRAMKAGAKGIISAGSGNGSIHQDTEKGLAEAVKKGVVVVRSSRTGSGIVTPSDPDNQYTKAGFLNGYSLNPQKARILLQLALTKTQDPKEIQRMFTEY